MIELLSVAEVQRREICPCRHVDHLDGTGKCLTTGCTCQRPPLAEEHSEDWATRGADRSDDPICQRMSRCARDRQWRFMERVLWHGILWFSPWNKRRLPTLEDEWRDCLLLGLDIMQRWQQHPDWFLMGVWDDTRDARPIALTEAGYQALCHRDRYDADPYHGGLIQPGWIATPATEEKDCP